MTSNEQLNDRIQRIAGMDDCEIAEAIKDENVLVRVRAISEAATRALREQSVLQAIESAANDTRVFWNQYLVRDFAEAALVILDVKRYAGNQERVRELISAKLDIF